MNYFRQIFYTFLIVSIFSGCQTKTERLPNIVLIFTDDQGYGDVGVYGSIGFETPNLDRLSKEGVRFTSFYSAQAVCSASRAGLLTGCYPNRIGISGALSPSAQHGIHEDEMTMAELLKQKGYATAIFGKWHLGHHKRFLPLQHGFDEYLGIPYSNDMWPVHYDGTPVTDTSLNAHRKNYPVLPLVDGNEKVRELTTLDDQDELTTLYTERAIDFINRHKEDPFFLYLPHSMPHVPLGVSDKFRGKSQQGMYGDVMMEIDWSVGEILRTLRENALEENTLVIFTTDNGPWMNYGNHAGSTGGLREAKGTSFEGGQRVPCIMRYPGVTQEGTVCHQLASTIDILPTIAELTGTTLPDHKIDGISILPLLKGEQGADPRKEFLYYYQRNSLEAVRKGDWKLIFPHPSRSYIGVIPGNDGWPGPYNHVTTELELYDLRRDPGERYNVISAHPDIVRELNAIADAARLDLGDDLKEMSGARVREPGKLQAE